MKTFKYTAKSYEGNRSEGVVEANTQDEAVAALRGDGVIVSTIEQVSGDHDIDLRIGGHKTKEKVLAIVCKQFSIILKAGLPIVRTVQLVADQIDDKSFKKILMNVADDAAAGYGLADSLAKHGNNLPSTFIETIRAGEESGNLDTVFERLSRFYEKSSKTKSKVVSSMIYPCFVLGIAVIVVIVIMVFAVPTFTTSFASMGNDLPWITQALISTSDFFTHYILHMIVVVVVLVVALKIAKKNEAFRLKWAKLGLRIPVIGRINRMSCASQYASTMSTMLAAGLPVTQAVEVTARAISNYYMSSLLSDILPDLEAGKQLSTCLAKTDAWPSLICDMTAVGEESGSLEDTLEVISEYYDNEVEVASSRAMSILEPVMIVILALIVGSILLAVYLPIFSMYSMYGN